jgi:hypothetical protein
MDFWLSNCSTSFLSHEAFFAQRFNGKTIAFIENLPARDPVKRFFSGAPNGISG